MGIMHGFRFVLFMGVLSFFSCQKGQDFVEEPPSDNLCHSANVVLETVSFPLCKDDAFKIVEPICRKYPDRWVDISNEIIPAGTKIAYNTMGQQVDHDDLSYCQSPDYDSWLLVVDKDLSILGRQHLIHIFVDVKSGDYSIQELEGRAIVDWDISRNIYVFPEEVNGNNEMNIVRPPERSLGTTSWAIIISGGCNVYNNYSAYYQDCANIYSKLTQDLGYPKGNIFCLISDGTDPAIDQRAGFNIYVNSDLDLDDDGTNDIQYEASKSNISSVFDNLSVLVHPGDEVLVFITDHGDEDGCIYLWGTETFWPSELNTELNKLGSSVLVDVVMGQSYSGAFIAPLSASNRTIATACSTTESGMIRPFHYTLFLHYWTEHISYCASNGDRYVRPSELFQSANQSTVSSFQHPQYISTPSSFGWSHCIEGGGVIPHIIGSDYLSTNINSLYSIETFPNTNSVTWSVDHSATLVSYTDSTAVIKGLITEPLQFCSTLAHINASFIVNGRQHSISKIINAIWKPGYYYNGNHIWGSNGTYHVRYLGGEYGYEWYSTNPAWQITGYIASTVTVLEGNTNESVNLVSVFYDPFGEMIVVSDQVH